MKMNENIKALQAPILVILSIIGLFLTSCSHNPITESTMSIESTMSTESTSTIETTSTSLVLSESVQVIVDPAEIQANINSNTEIFPLNPLHSCGYANTDGTYYYVSNPDGLLGELVKINKETHAKEVILEASVYGLNYWDGWLYFMNHSEDSGVFKMRTDGTGYVKLLDGWVNHLYVINGELYYNHDDRELLEKMSLNGEYGGIVIEDNAIFLLQWENRIFYLDGAWDLCSIDAQNNVQKFTNGANIMNYGVHDDGIYYSSGGVKFIDHQGKNSRVLLKNAPIRAYYGETDFFYTIEESISEEDAYDINQYTYSGEKVKQIYTSKTLLPHGGFIVIDGRIFIIEDNPEYVYADYLYYIQDAKLYGPLNEKSLNPPLTMKKKQ